MARGIPAHPKAFRGFVNVPAENASSRTTPQLPRDLSDVSLAHLVLTDAQRSAILARTSEEKHIYDSAAEGDQLAAASFLASHRLDLDARECLENKWHVRWTVKSGGKDVEQTCRVLYQW